MAAGRVRLGIERLLDEDRALVEGKRVGLITNHSGVDGRLRATADRLHRQAGVRLQALFGPEHGMRGAAADGAAVGSGIDPRTGVPVHSLYGDRHQPEPQALSGLDVLVFDLQDVGARFYTYLYTMSLAMQAAAARQLRFVVLDRPNPIGGEQVEGPVLDPGFASFVGMYPMPIRYGLTIGEVAALFNREFGIQAELRVVELSGWRRTGYWEETGLPWVPPSPNMPTVDTAVVYPGTCLVEGTSLSEGRGTAKPFEQVGAPWLDGQALADRLEALQLPGVAFRPVWFEPSASKYAGRLCSGVQVHVLERGSFAPVRVGLEILAAVRHGWPDHFAWHLSEQGLYHFDRLAGTDQVRRALDAGMPAAELMAGWQAAQAAFERVRARYLLYRG
jgi:uncharacterized protein YbbC (DUF1343 family)